MGIRKAVSFASAAALIALDAAMLSGCTCLARSSLSVGLGVAPTSSEPGTTGTVTLPDRASVVSCPGDSVFLVWSHDDKSTVERSELQPPGVDAPISPNPSAPFAHAPTTTTEYVLTSFGKDDGGGDCSTTTTVQAVVITSPTGISVETTSGRSHWNLRVSPAAFSKRLCVLRLTLREETLNLLPTLTRRFGLLTITHLADSGASSVKTVALRDLAGSPANAVIELDPSWQFVGEYSFELSGTDPLEKSMSLRFMALIECGDCNSSPGR